MLMQPASGCEHLTGLEDSGVVLADRGKLVDVEPDTVAGSMTEGIAEPGFGDDRSTGVVDRLGLDARGDHSDGSSLRLGDQRKNLAGDIVRRIRATDDKRTSHIAAVPVDDCADINDQKIADLERPIARTSMRQRGVGARRNNRLIRRTGPTRGPHGVVERKPELPLGRAGRPQHFGVGERGVGECRCRLDTGQLRWILDTAQLPKKSGDGHEFAVGECRSPLVLLIPADDIAFERNPGCARERICATGNQILADDDGGIASCSRKLGGRLRGVAAVSGQHHGFGGDDEEAIGTGETREPTHTREIGHDKAVELALEHGVEQPVSPALHVQYREVHRTAANEAASTSGSTPTTGSTPLGPSSTKVTPSIAFLSREKRSINSVSVSCSGTVVGSS